MLRWLKTVVVNDGEKAHLMRQVGTGKAYRKECQRSGTHAVGSVEMGYERHQKQGNVNLCEQPGGSPLTGQVMSGVKAARARSAASAWNVRTRGVIPPGATAGARKEGVCRGSNQGIEYRCAPRGRTGS